MKKVIVFFVMMVVLFSCDKKEDPVRFVSYDESSEIASQQNHEVDRMKFKLIQSKYLDMNAVFEP
ncbi:MAG: amidase, partial [Bacteroidetes bacterium]|nr:amidase [Bacteroidota bacterium]